MPFTGRQLYNKNVSFDFGYCVLILFTRITKQLFRRCPARAMFPLAFDLLGEHLSRVFTLRSHSPTVKRQDVFGEVGGLDSLVDRIVGPDEAPEMYEAFDQSKVGKVIFDMRK